MGINQVLHDEREIGEISLGNGVSMTFDDILTISVNRIRGILGDL